MIQMPLFDIDEDDRKWQDLVESMFLKPRREADKGEGCPECGDPGEFIRMALCCPQHGPFAGC